MAVPRHTRLGGVMIAVTLLATAAPAALADAADAQDNFLMGRGGAATVVVNQTSGVANGAWVHVDFSGVAAADREGCWLGLFTPADANVSAIDPNLPSPCGVCTDVPHTASAPIKWQRCGWNNPSFYQTGAGGDDVHLLNVRDTVGIKLFTGPVNTSLLHPRLLASSPPITFARPQEPMHVHLALTDDPTEMRVMWTSAPVDAPTVEYGPSSSELTSSVSAVSQTYGRDDLCGPPANREGFVDPGWMHRAVIGGLKPSSGTRTFYRVGSPDGGWSPVYSFPAPQGPNNATDVLMHVTADVGGTAMDAWAAHWSDPVKGGCESLANLTLQNVGKGPEPAVVIHDGDLSYATGYTAKWEMFMSEVEPVASHVPYMVSLGNHERDWPGTGTVGGEDSGGECGTPTEWRFTMPTPSRKPDDAWYSMDIGPVHVVMMFTEVPCGRGSAQYEFLEADLAGVNRLQTPWVVLSGHRPMYSVSSSGGGGPDHSNNFCDGAVDMEPLLLKYHVDLAIWGHVHNALVTCPLNNGTCVGTKGPDGYDAPVHLCIGNGGQSLSGVPPPHLNPKWAVWSSNSWGWGTLRASSTALTFTFLGDLSDAEQYAVTLNRTFPRA